MATHSSVLAWWIPGTGEPGGLPSVGSHRVRHDWHDLVAAAAAVEVMKFQLIYSNPKRWCCESAVLNMPANLENSAWPQDWKKSISNPIPKKGNAKECSNYHTIALVSRASQAMLKILQTRLQQHLNCELPDVQAGFRKGRGTRAQIGNICWIIKKWREFQKNIYFCFIDYAKAFV